jgi:hypothetical protein
MKQEPQSPTQKIVKLARFDVKNEQPEESVYAKMTEAPRQSDARTTPKNTVWARVKKEECKESVMKKEESVSPHEARRKAFAGLNHEEWQADSADGMDDEVKGADSISSVSIIDSSNDTPSAVPEPRLYHSDHSPAADKCCHDPPAADERDAPATQEVQPRTTRYRLDYIHVPSLAEIHRDKRVSNLDYIN